MQTFSAPAPKRVSSAVSAIARLNIGGKLTAAFVAMLLMMAALGGFSILSMSRVSQLSAHIADRWLPATRLTGELHAYTAEYRLQQSTAFLSFDPMAQAAGMEQVTKLDARVANILKTIEAMDASPQEKTLFGHIKTKWASYREQHAQMVTLMQQNQAAGILDIYNGAALQTYTSLEKDVSSLSTLKENGGKSAIDAGNSIYTLATVTTLISLVVAMGAAAALLGLLLRNIARPLDGMTNAVERLAAGDVAVSVPALDRRDEIGKLARATDSFKTFFAMERERTAHEQEQARQTTQMVEALGTALQGLADGDLTAEVSLPIEGPLARIRDDYNEAVAKLRNTMVTLAGAATSIHSGSGEIAQSADDLSRRTEYQAANVEETAAAMMEVTQNVKSSARGAVEASKIVSQAQAEAQTSRQVVVRAVDAMNEIEKSSQQISQIISVIDQIAFQTNLLALNAGVEAARAGESGRGFAVVANEVRSLALRSAGAAKEITHLISTSTAQVTTGVALVSQAGSAIGGIVAKVDEINTLVSQIASTAEQQASGLALVNNSVGEMEKLTQQNAAMVEENTAASRSLAAEADQLGKLVGRFELGADARFLQNAPAPVRELRRAGGGRRG